MFFAGKLIGSKVRFIDRQFEMGALHFLQFRIVSVVLAEGQKFGRRKPLPGSSMGSKVNLCNI